MFSENAGGVNFWMGFDIGVKSYDVAMGSPTVRSYIAVKEPTCNYLVTWTSWDNSFGRVKIQLKVFYDTNGNS